MSVISTGIVATRNFFEANYYTLLYKSNTYILRYACLVLKRERDILH